MLGRRGSLDLDHPLGAETGCLSYSLPAFYVPLSVWITGAGRGRRLRPGRVEPAAPGRLEVSYPSVAALRRYFAALR